MAPTADYLSPQPNYRVGATFRWLGSSPIEYAELFLTVCGIEHCLPGKFYGPTVRNDFHVHFILSGKGTLEIGGQTYRLGRGQIFTIPPDVETYYYADTQDPWHYTWVSFGGSKAAFYMEKAGFTPACPVRDAYLNPEDFLALTEKILNHHELVIANELTRTALLYELLALLINSRTRNLEQHHKPHPLDYSPDIYVNHAIEYIHTNYRDARISDIASYIGITRSYLAHIFKQKLNVSPQEYLLAYRLDQGSRLLRATNQSVREVAVSVGYDNPLTFSKMFKNAYGLSPKNYRQHILDKNLPSLPSKV